MLQTGTYSPTSRESLVASWLTGLAEQIDPDFKANLDDGKPLPGAELGWREWLARDFSHRVTHPFAEHHVRLWEWIEALQPGARPRPIIEVWGRGGGKSSTVEMGCARVAVKLSRRFCLYVSETQDQADKHVEEVGDSFDALNIERAVNKYGYSRGWRHNELRTANGFNIAALGLEKAARGIKIRGHRPDLIIFDDIDSDQDTIKTIKKKVDAITKKIIPSGSMDCAVLGVQNAVHEDGIFSQLVDGRADFLHDRMVAGMVPAAHGLIYEIQRLENGRNEYKVTGGHPTWEGQDLATIEWQITQWGLRAFLQEAQHEVKGVGGYVFNTSEFRYCTIAELPQLTSVCLAWDLAATEGGGDYTVGVLMGKDANDLYYVLAVIRGQWGSERVRQAIDAASAFYKRIFPRLILRLPQDPGQAGVAQKNEMRKGLADYGPIINPVTGKKATRASNYAEAVNLGNVFLLQEDLPDCLAPLIQDRRWQTWQTEYKFVLKRFDENVTDQPDDDVDASADAYNELAGKRIIKLA